MPLPNNDELDDTDLDEEDEELEGFGLTDDEDAPASDDNDFATYNDEE